MCVGCGHRPIRLRARVVPMVPGGCDMNGGGDSHIPRDLRAPGPEQSPLPGTLEWFQSQHPMEQQEEEGATGDNGGGASTLSIAVLVRGGRAPLCLSLFW